MWQYIIPAVSAVIVALIEARAAKERKQTKAQKEKEEMREERRAEESRLSMQMMSATLQLSVVTANALTGGHNNGNVETAKHAAQAAQEEYQAFLQRVAAAEIAKK
ncbi:MAG: hypothetical protein IKZ82_06190 [Clostridia bacterium]|nr:hypothetical protein [Clostridia bacterium]